MKNPFLRFLGKHAASRPDPQAFQGNMDLNRAEILARRAELSSMPGYLGLALGTQCNLRCLHCYQPKTGPHLLRTAGLSRRLRRELKALYPHLQTLRLLGGEVFAMKEFPELLEDVTSVVNRPLVSVSTNATLIDDAWAERIVKMPFATVTVSVDGATPATYARLRRGGELRQVLANIDRIQDWKRRLSSSLPNLDAFFVVLRSNFREIPQYLELMQQHGITEVSLQAAEVSDTNRAQIQDELIADPADVACLHEILTRALPEQRKRFRFIRLCGLRTMFEEHGLDTSFLMEEGEGLYPGSDGLDTSTLCPNPWRILFVTETGDARLCFLAEPIGNVRDASLIELWNCPKAVAMRSRLVAGQYLAAGCSEQFCGWRESLAARTAGAF